MIWACGVACLHVVGARVHVRPVHHSTAQLSDIVRGDGLRICERAREVLGHADLVRPDEWVGRDDLRSFSNSDLIDDVRPDEWVGRDDLRSLWCVQRRMMCVLVVEEGRGDESIEDGRA